MDMHVFIRELEILDCVAQCADKNGEKNTNANVHVAETRQGMTSLPALCRQYATQSASWMSDLFYKLLGQLIKV